MPRCQHVRRGGHRRIDDAGAPLERRLATIAGVTEITSASSLGLSNIAIQFDLKRTIDGAARAGEAAAKAALARLA